MNPKITISILTMNEEVNHGCFKVERLDDIYKNLDIDFHTNDYDLIGGTDLDEAFYENGPLSSDKLKQLRDYISTIPKNDVIKGIENGKRFERYFKDIDCLVQIEEDPTNEPT